MTSKGPTIDVGAWLRGLGLGEYEATYRENAIDDTVLPEPNGRGLEGLGRRHRRAPPQAARRYR